MDIKSKEIQIVDIASLIPNPKNNNKHPKEQIDRLASLIKYQGFRNPLVVSNRSGFVLCGHGRIEAAKLAGLKQVPVMFQDFENEAQEYAYLTSDNAIASWAELDLAMVNQEMLDLGPDFDIDLLGIKDFVIEPVEKFEPQGDENDIPEVTHAITRKGDLWLLGDHRLLCGDSTMLDDVEKAMGGVKADMIHTDPPYNIAYKGGSKVRDEIQNDDMGDNFPEFLNKVYTNLNMVTKPGGAIYVWHASIETHRFIQGFIDAGFLFKSYIVWNKNNSTFGRSDYHWKHEPCIYGWKDGGSHKWCGDRKQTTVWDVDRPSRSDEHPTMKPLDLCERAIINSSDVRDVILDVFLGSGSTMIAAQKSGRKCYGLELSEKYCDVIINRWQNYTGKKATLESTGQTYEELKAERDS